MSAAQREHGTRAKYVAEKCRCEDCRQANREYARSRESRRTIGRGQWPWVEAHEAREHVRWLEGHDMGYKRVARLAGVSESVLARLLYGVKSETHPKPPSNKIRVEHHDAILAVSASDSPTEDAARTWQMLDCLIAFGIPRYKIAHALGYRRAAPRLPSLQISRRRVSRANASAVEHLHWNAWHASPELRVHCRCERPQRLLQDAA